MDEIVYLIVFSIIILMFLAVYLAWSRFNLNIPEDILRQLKQKYGKTTIILFLLIQAAALISIPLSILFPEHNLLVRYIVLFFVVVFLYGFLGTCLIYGSITKKLNSIDKLIERPDMAMLSKIDSGFIPEKGFVPDHETALKIAKAVWLSVYGKDYLKWRGYKVKFEDNIWYIESICKEHKFFGISGGSLFIKIDKIKGTILDVSRT